VAVKDGFWAHHSDSDSGPWIATEQSGNANATDANAVDTADLSAPDATSSADPSGPPHTDGTTAIGDGDPAPAVDAGAGLSDSGNVVPTRDGFWPVNDGGAGGVGGPANAETSSAVSAAAMQPAAVDNGNVVPVSDGSGIFSAAPDANNATGGLNDGGFVSDGGAATASFSDAHPGSPDGADPVASHGGGAAAAAGHAQPSPPPPPELPVVTVIASAAMALLSLSILSRVLSCGKPGEMEPAAAGIVVEA
jgi:hypothetical protein